MDNTTTESLSTTKEASSQPIIKDIQTVNFWTYAAILELGIIIFLLFRRRPQTKKKSDPMRDFKREAMKERVDFDNLTNSFFNAQQLYDELKVRCHPDRFTTDERKNAIAEELFQQVTQNKRNVKKLQEIKSEAERKLNINFKN